jgi:hypothetical protein
MAAKDGHIGHWFEGKTREALDTLVAQQGLFFCRLQDSRAAGKFLPNTPADFLVGFCGKARLLECKASVKHDSLVECLHMIDDGQAAYHTLWHNNGLPSTYLFYSDRTGMVECWSGASLIRTAKKTVALCDGSVPAVCRLDDLALSLSSWLKS